MLREAAKISGELSLMPFTVLAHLGIFAPL
jgi:hypothetical protein